MAVCASLSSDSGIGVNGKSATGERDSAEAGPDQLAVVRRDAGVLGAETVGCRRVEACIAGVECFFCDSLEKNLKNGKQ